MTPAGNKVILTVSDTGRGIPADKLHTVWNKCKWPREEETCVDRGIGTGLMVVQHIARLHGGSAVLESHEGQGTKVTVILPVVQENELELSSSITNYKTKNMTHILTELSELLGYEYYFEEFMD
jgi:signal transduction histidine kinase